MEHKLDELEKFLKSEIYKDFLSLSDEYYNLAFAKALDSSKPPDERLSSLEMMKGINLIKNAFLMVKEQYIDESSLIEQGERDE